MPNVIVIGASRGIGRELATRYAADGWQVLATVRKAEDAGQFDGVAGVTTAIADTGDASSLAALPEFAADLIVVNAGVGSQEPKVASIDPANWTRVMTVNALGPLLVAATLGERLKDGGTFVSLSSLMGSIADNGAGGAYSYRMSKAALNMGMQNLALEWRARGIAVAALHPGWVKTDMGGGNAPLEIADSVAGLRKVIAGLTAGKDAGFVDYSGKALPW
ncbi:SDR family oxidoreductase [Glacieibacterium frigidum]|uniref:SDR family oxidoreductase n=1 Tax=Glacieibacterium frigidum TaxID=2593303 RepID=A0A552U8N3_9SPHN|nr:SDR family oxidoreductase [Glacieibacterium frigidum]TRW14549.1 SDR family oxidoreductase [Glacieibacterium frigidum]